MAGTMNFASVDSVKEASRLNGVDTSISKTLLGIYKGKFVV